MTVTTDVVNDGWEAVSVVPVPVEIPVSVPDPLTEEGISGCVTVT